MRRVVAVIAAMLLTGCAADVPDDARVLTLSGSIMGTQYRVQIVDPPKQDDAAAALGRAVETRLAELEGLLSTYDPASDVSRLNRSESIQWTGVSQATADVVAEGIQAGHYTEGAFDITSGPLVNLWGFGPEHHPPGRVPDDEQIAKAKAAVGLEYIEYQLNPPAVRKTKPEVQVDLSGVAKGYAVDQIALLLREARIRSFLVDLGGDMRARGVNPQGQPWRIGVEAPLAGVRSIHRVVELADTALATSGDYRNYFERGGKRYSHIIDPRTGRPIQHRLVSVSILDPSCARADALATGLLVLGPEEGYRVATEQRLAALLIVATEAGFVERMTPEFEAACLPPP